MNLDELPLNEDETIVHKGLFSSLGKFGDRNEGMLCCFHNPAYARELNERAGAVSCVITGVGMVDACPGGMGIVTSPDPVGTFYRLHDFLASDTDFYGKRFAREIDGTAIVSDRAFIAQENIRIGPGVVIEAMACVMEGCDIGEGAIIRAGCVVGSVGFDNKLIRGRLKNTTHAGGVRIGPGVEILANSSVNRGTFNLATQIGVDSKLGELVQLGHNASIGERVRIAAGTIIGGGVDIGDDVWMGPNCATTYGILIGAGAHVGFGSVVAQNVPAGMRVMGNPARPLPMPKKG